MGFLEGQNSDVAELSGEEFREILEEMDEGGMWSYLVSEDLAPDGDPIPGVHRITTATLSEYLECFRDVGFNAVISSTLSDEDEGPNTYFYIGFNDPLSGEDYEERIGDLDFVPNYAELADHDLEKVVQVYFLDVPSELKGYTINYLED